jgi:hypothetical protein
MASQDRRSAKSWRSNRAAESFLFASCARWTSYFCASSGAAVPSDGIAIASPVTTAMGILCISNLLFNVEKQLHSS